MKKILIAGCSLGLATFSFGQQKEGKVTYERTTQMQVRFADGNDEMERMIPKSRTDKFVLTFVNNQSLWKQAEQENNDDNDFGSGGMQIKMVVAGSDDVMYCNFDAAKKVEQREVF